MGMAAGLAWLASADAVVVYHDLGYSEGMKAELRAAMAANVRSEFRSLPGWTSADPSLCPHDVSRRRPCLLCATADAPVTQELPIITLEEPDR